MPPISNIFNVVPDEVDARDYKFSASAIPSRTLEVEGQMPSSVDLRKGGNYFLPAYDQGQLNSCTANAAAALLYFDMVRIGTKDIFDPSRMFVYFNERALADAVYGYGSRGAPATIRNCMKTINKNGYCSEDLWPYDETQLETKPNDLAYTFAEDHRSKRYESIEQNLDDLRNCLAIGHPFMFGIDLYTSYKSSKVKKSGNIPLPNFDRESIVGGHALAAVGYDDAQECFIIRNSFGTDWGEQGYGTVPYDYMMNTKHAWGFWVIYTVIDLD